MLTKMFLNFYFKHLQMVYKVNSKVPGIAKVIVYTPVPKRTPFTSTRTEDTGIGYYLAREIWIKKKKKKGTSVKTQKDF
jgi:hypothetical protein